MTEGTGAASRGKRSLGRIILLVCLVAGLAWWLRSTLGDAQDKGKNSRGQRPVAVSTTKARLGDVPVTLTGLGTVTPLKNVTVRSRVDGQLIEVRYKEGQMVKEGDLLARIDPRPFEALVMVFRYRPVDGVAPTPVRYRGREHFHWPRPARPGED